jgi:hypothetical protein
VTDKLRKPHHQLGRQCFKIIFRADFSQDTVSLVSSSKNREFIVNKKICQCGNREKKKQKNQCLFCTYQQEKQD